MIRSSILLSAISVFVSVISLASQLAIAKAFGVSMSLDSYLIAASAPTVFTGLVAAVMSYSLLPRLVKYADAVEIFQSLNSVILRLILSVVSTACVAGWFLAPFVVQSLGGHLSPKYQDSVVFMVRVAWFAAGIQLLINFVIVVLTAVKKYYFCALISTIPYATVLIAVTYFGSALGAEVIPLATLLGVALGVVVLLLRAYPYLTSANNSWPPEFATRSLLSSCFIAVLALSCFSSYALIDAYFASPLGTGALSTLGYAQRLIIAVGNLAIAGPAVMLSVSITETELRNGRTAAREAILQMVRLVLMVSVGIALVSALFARPIVQLIFERGAFDKDATNRLVELLPYMLSGMIPMLGSVILIRGLFQLGEEISAAALGIVWTVGYAIVAGLFSRQMGLNGMGVAYATCWWIVLIIGLYRLASVGDQNESKSSTWVAFITVTLTSAAAAGFIIRRYLQPTQLLTIQNSLINTGVFIALCFLSLAAYVFIYTALSLLPRMRGARLWHGVQLVGGGQRHG